MPNPRYPNVKVQLTGEDGNAFAIIGAVSKALRREEGSEAATAWTTYAMDSSSYDELLARAMETVVVL
jgi:hypothetical protein